MLHWSKIFHPGFVLDIVSYTQEHTEHTVTYSVQTVLQAGMQLRASISPD